MLKKVWKEGILGREGQSVRGGPVKDSEVFMCGKGLSCSSREPRRRLIVGVCDRRTAKRKS